MPTVPASTNEFSNVNPADVMLPVLTGADYCDRCERGNAVAIVSMGSHGELYLCANHWRALRKHFTNNPVSFKRRMSDGTIVDERKSVDW